MIQLTPADATLADTEQVIRHFPFRIGRSAGNHCRVERAGVWDEHAVVELELGRPTLIACGSGTLLVNGEAVTRHILRSGDLVVVGSVRWLVSVSPAKQKAAEFSQAVFWLAFAALFAAQVFAIYRLTDQ